MDGRHIRVSAPAYLGPVTSTYTVRNTEWLSLSISAFCCNGYVRRSDCLQYVARVSSFCTSVRRPSALALIRHVCAVGGYVTSGELRLFSE